MTLADWAAIAQIGIWLATVVGVFLSMYLSVKALREVQRDRKARHRPHLAFEPGGYQLKVAFVKAGQTIPGVNPAFVKERFPRLRDDAESVRLADETAGEADHGRGVSRYGRLRNFGLGPALEVRVTWIPSEVWVGSERFVLDADKLREPQYMRVLNSMPAVPAHIQPGEAAQLTRLPTFIDKDCEHKISRVSGTMEIACLDVFGDGLMWNQEFMLFTMYGETPPKVHVTFGDLRSGGRPADARSCGKSWIG